MRLEFLTEVDGGIGNRRDAHEFHDIEADVIIHGGRKSDVAKVFEEDAAFDVVRVELADTVEFVKGERGEVRRGRVVTRDADLLRDGLWHRAVVGRVHRGDARIGDLNLRPVKAAFRPEDGAHRVVGIGRDGEGFRERFIPAVAGGAERDPQNVHASRLMGEDLLRVRAVVIGVRGRDLLQRVGRDDFTGIARERDVVGTGAGDCGDGLAEECGAGDESGHVLEGCDGDLGAGHVTAGDLHFHFGNGCAASLIESAARAVKRREGLTHLHGL